MFYSRSKRTIHRRKGPAILVALIIGGIIVALLTRTDEHKKLPQNTPIHNNKTDEERELSPSIPIDFEAPQGSIFIPYWKVNALAEPVLPTLIKHAEVKNLIYFGITPDETGAVQKSEPGYAQLASFVEKTASFKGKKLLGIRMLNEKINEAILNDPAAQDIFLRDILSTVSELEFEGVVLDLEHSVLPTSEVVQSITAFLANTAAAMHAQNKSFSVTLYGDTFYRQRPYDVEKIASFSDEIFVMSYDFHKSYGEPGPNFPLFKGNSYSYDFVTMVDDFLAQVPPQKLTFLFGLYGYDWAVDSQNRPLKSASSLTLGQIERVLLPRCTKNELNCTVTRDKNAHENSILYKAADGQAHTVWYEDGTSIKAKTGYLSTKHVSSVGYWAFGYY